MENEFAQGRLKVSTASKSCLELIYSWPKSEQIINEDSDLLINIAMVWYFIDRDQVQPSHWNKEAVDAVIQEWIKIPTNTMLDATVKNYSMVLLSNLFNIIWLERCNIHLLRKYKEVFAKAAMDLESTTVAGFLKIAVVKYANQPEILSFNGTSRKITTRHFACTVMVVNRGKASSLDIENFYAMLNKNGGTEIKVSLLKQNCI